MAYGDIRGEGGILGLTLFLLYSIFLLDMQRHFVRLQTFDLKLPMENTW
jgi:hypothetical protein